MASAEEYAAWIVANANKRGTPEFDTVAKAYQLARGGVDFGKLQQDTATRREIEQRVATDPISQDALETSQETKVPRWLGGNPDASLPERIAGAPMTRFALGAAAPAIGAAQLVGNMGGAGNDPKNLFSNQRVEQMQQMTEAGRGESGFDPAMFAGNVMSPVGLAAAKVISPAATWYGRAAQGAGIGAGFGASAPVTDGGENYWSDKGIQTGMGAAIGGGVPLAIDTAKNAGAFLRHGYRGAVEPFFQKGREMAQGRDYNDVAGPRAQELAAALRNPQGSVPGYKPTAAEVAASLPASATQAGQAEFAGLQANVTPSAPSTASAVNQSQGKALADAIRSFGGTKNDLKWHEEGRAAVTSPMREEALANANTAGVKVPELQARLAGQNDSLVSALQDKGRFQTFGQQSANRAEAGAPGWISNADRVPEAQSAVADTTQIIANRKAQAGLTQYQLDSLAAHGSYPLEAQKVLGAIDQMLTTPEDRAVSLNQKILGAVRDKIASLADKNGTIDSRDLYAIRKTDINDVVATLTKDMDASTKNRAATLVSSIKSDIDNAIEGAGGTGWKDYLRTYTNMSRDIDQKKIGQALEGKLTDALQGDASLRPQAYAAALRDSANIPQKASGAPRYTAMEDALTPQNMQTVNDVGSTLATQAMAKQLGTAGSTRAAELTGTPDIIVPPSLSRTGMALRFAARLLQGKGTSKMDQEMARDMLTNPQRVSELMTNAATRAKNMDQFVQALRKYSPLATQGAALNQGVQE